MKYLVGMLCGAGIVAGASLAAKQDWLPGKPAAANGFDLRPYLVAAPLGALAAYAISKV